MTGIIDKIKEVTSHSKSQNNNDEAAFSIQPHPATTNNPADLQSPQAGEPGGGMASARDPASSVYNSAPGPVIPNAQMQEAVGQQQVKGSDELKMRAAELNQ